MRDRVTSHRAEAKLPLRLCVLAALLALALSPPARAEAPDKVTFGYFPVADFLITFIAKDKGFFERHGIDATIQLMASNATSIPAAVTSGSIQIGATTLPVVLQAAENGLDIKVLAGSGAYYPGFHAVALVVPAASEMRAAKDLEGKTIALTGINNMVHILLVKWLADQRAAPGKIRFVEAAIAQIPDILKSGQSDAVVAIEPFLSRMIAGGGARVLAYFQDIVPPGTATMVWSIEGAYAASHADLVARMRAALGDALAYHEAHPDEDEAILAHYLPMPPPVLKAIPKPRYVNGLDPAQLDFWSRLMRGQNLLTRPADRAVILP